MFSRSGFATKSHYSGIACLSATLLALAGCAAPTARPTHSPQVPTAHAGAAKPGPLKARVISETGLIAKAFGKSQKTDLSTIDASYGIYQQGLYDMALYYNRAVRAMHQFVPFMHKVEGTLARARRDPAGLDLNETTQSLVLYRKVLQNTLDDLNDLSKTYVYVMERTGHAPSADRQLVDGLVQGFMYGHTKMQGGLEKIIDLADAEIDYFGYLRDARADGRVTLVNGKFVPADETTRSEMTLRIWKMVDKFKDVKALIDRAKQG